MTVSKALVKRTLASTGMLRTVEKMRRRDVVLAYHGVTRDPTGPNNLRGLHAGVDAFERQLDLLQEMFDVVPLATLLAPASHRDADHTRPRAALTFDDGYRNFASLAAPILVRRAIHATVFVPTGAVGSRLWMDDVELAVLHASRWRITWRGRTLDLATDARRASAARRLSAELDRLDADERRAEIDSLVRELRPRHPSGPCDDRDLLTWDELRELQSGGLEVGSHCESHEMLPGLGPQASEGEVAASLAELRLRLHEQPGWALAYPFGMHDDNLERAAARAGYYCAVTTEGTGVPSDVRPFRVPRVLIGNDSDVDFRCALLGLRNVGQRLRGYAS